MTLVLGIESSCDETAASVVRVERGSARVLSNAVASQHELHAEFGGVVPEIASRAHVERLLPTLRRALADAAVPLSDVDAVAVGHRPGLIGALLVGVASAKSLAWTLGVPVVGVDHVAAHLVAGDLDRDRAPARARDWPALGLVVSGGHTALYWMESPLAVRVLGSTIDDAVGEAFDKAAVMLGLGHPGGPAIDALAAAGDDRAADLPVSRLGPDSLDFSFSGLKTALLYTVRGKPGPDASGPRGYRRDWTDLTRQERADLAASFQRAAVAAVTLKIRRAVEGIRARGAAPARLVVGGGVSANSRLRAELARLARELELGLVLPPVAYCVDNAAMIAALGGLRLDARDQRDTGLGLTASPATGVSERVALDALGATA